jgi:hypothetical protein
VLSRMRISFERSSFGSAPAEPSDVAKMSL